MDINQSWAGLRGTNGIANSHGWAGLQSAYSPSSSEPDGGGIYRLINGEFVEANYSEPGVGRASWENSDSGSGDRMFSAGTGGGGAGNGGFIYNGVWAANKGGKTMKSLGPARDYFSYYDNPMVRRKVANARIAERLRREWDSASADERKRIVKRGRAYVDGDIAGFAGKGDAAALREFYNARKAALEGRGEQKYYETLRKKRLAVLETAKENDPQDHRAKYEAARAAKGKFNNAELSAEAWAKERSLGATKSSYKSWVMQKKHEIEHARSVDASNHKWNEILAERKIARARERVEAVDHMEASDKAMVKKIETELKRLDDKNVREVAEQLSGSAVVRYQGTVAPLPPNTEVVIPDEDPGGEATPGKNNSAHKEAGGNAAMKAGRASRRTLVPRRGGR